MSKIKSFLRNPRVVTSATSWLIFIIALTLGYSGIELKYLIPVYILGIIIGGFFFAQEAIEKLFEKRRIGVELLMSVGIVGAAILGEWQEALLLVGLYSISEAIESYTTDKTRSAIRALMDLVPKKALVKRNGKEEIVSAEALKIGEIIIVRPGESIATDGVIKKGSASINQAVIAGESIPVFKKEGDQVFSGTINEDGVIEIEIAKTFQNNTIAKIIHLVEAAQKEKGRRQQMVEKFSYAFSPIVLGISVGIPFVLPFFGFSLMDSFVRAVTFVVAASPCAFAVSIPVAFASAMGTSARKGVLIKGGIYLEELADIKVIAFDKTGTLTTGKPKLINIVPLNHCSQEELLKIAGALAGRSTHPLDKAVQEYLDGKGIDAPICEDYQSIAGSGIKGSVGNQTYYLGSPFFFKQLGHSPESAKEFKELSVEGKTVVFVGTKEKIYGLLAIADTPRQEAKETISNLRALGVHSIMLTGDNKLVGESIGKELGVDSVLSELKPDDKVDRIKELKEKYQHVAMVGDGINDAPALAESPVGLAMGTAGTDAALEAANVAIMGDDLSKIPYAIKLSRFAKKIVFQNLIFSTILQVVAMVLAIFMFLSVSQILFIDEFGEVLVILNGLRLLNGRV